MLRVAGFVKESIVDGPGIRYVIFTQGCAHNCPGCHNLHTHNYLGGNLVDVDDVYKDILKNPLVKGVTISGGEPLDQLSEVLKLVLKLKSSGYNIIIFTGYRYEDIYEKSIQNSDYIQILQNVDIVIDGKYEKNNTNEFLRFRGSCNQRIIDSVKTLEKHEIVTVEI